MVERQKAYGYVRVSTREQNEARQMIAMREAGIPEGRVYVDRQSGGDFDRPQYRRLMRKLDSRSVLYVKSIDRLGRNYAELNEQWRIITKEKGADIVVLDMPLLDTRRGRDLLGTFISDIVLSLLSYVAENERVNIRQRQAEGIAAARARGVRFGRPPRALPENFHEVHRRWREGGDDPGGSGPGLQHGQEHVPREGKTLGNTMKFLRPERCTFPDFPLLSHHKAVYHFSQSVSTKTKFLD